jgi:hypothetical protein
MCYQTAITIMQIFHAELSTFCTLVRFSSSVFQQVFLLHLILFPTINHPLLYLLLHIPSILILPFYPFLPFCLVLASYLPSSLLSSSSRSFPLASSSSPSTFFLLSILFLPFHTLPLLSFLSLLSSPLPLPPLLFLTPLLSSFSQTILFLPFHDRPPPFILILLL